MELKAFKYYLEWQNIHGVWILDQDYEQGFDGLLEAKKAFDYEKSKHSRVFRVICYCTPQVIL